MVSPAEAPSFVLPALSTIVAGTMRWGAWGLTADSGGRWIEACVAHGITSFDHADIYGDYQVETQFGQALATRPGLRQRIQIITKCGIRLVSAARPAHRLKSYDASAEHIRRSVDASLRALQTDRIDLLLLHRPDPLMDPHEVAEAVMQLQRVGKVLAFGVSNFSAPQFELLNAALPLATNQIELNPLQREALYNGRLDQLLRLQRRPMLWSPLAGGRLMSPAADARSAQARVQWVLGELSARLGISAATVAYAWCLRHPSRPHVVTGTGRIEGLREAIEAQSLVLSREDWTSLWEAGAGREVA